MGNWLTDLNDGEACQIVVTAYLQSLDLLPTLVKQSSGYQPSHDVESSSGAKLEIKFDILATLTNNVAIEFERRKRKDGEVFKEASGIGISNADFWAIMVMQDQGDFFQEWALNEIHPQLLLIKKPDLAYYVANNNLRIVPMGDNKLTNGYIIPLGTLKKMPWCETLDVPLNLKHMDDLVYRLIKKLSRVNINLLRKFGKSLA